MLAPRLALGTRPTIRLRGRRRAATLVACAAALAAVAPLARRAFPLGTPSVDAIEASLLRDRFVVGRLARQSRWAPCAATDTAALVVRARCGGARERSAELESLAAAVTARRAVDGAARVLRLDALLDLRWLETTPAGIDRAIAALERAARDAPRDAAALNDLAVAHLARAERDQQLRPLLQALDAVERARALDDTSTAVLFNRALILERLQLVEGARRAWTRYLAAERLPGWREEGRAHLAALDALVSASAAAMPTVDTLLGASGARARAELPALAGRTPQWARESGFAALGAWGKAVGRGDTARARLALAVARDLARALDDTGGDRSVSLAVAAIDAGGAPARTRALARAHADYDTGVALYARGAYEGAVRALGRAEREFRAFGSPASGWAAHYRAGSLINRGEYAEADSILRALTSTAPRSAPVLRGKAIWTSGLGLTRRGSAEASNLRYRDAMPYFARARETESLGMLASLLAEGLNYAGQSTAGHVEALRGLRLLAPYRRSGFLTGHLGIVADFARADALHRAALAVLDEALALNAELDRPPALAWGHGERARSLFAVGRIDSARAEVDEAMRLSDRIDPGIGRDRFRAQIMLVSAQLARAVDPRGALDQLRGVLDTYRETNSETELPNALLEAALAAKDAGDGVTARRSLEEAVARIEARHPLFPTAAMRATYYETAEGVFDALVALELDAGRADAAFAYLERARAAAWAEPGGRPAAPHVADVQRRLRPGAVVVEYALLPDRVVTWVITPRTWRHHMVPVGRDSVAALVARLDAESALPDPDGRSASARLFDLLVRPVVGELRAASSVAVVPDRELSRVPFAALWDRTTRRFVVEDVAVRTLPSTAFLGAARGSGAGDAVGPGTSVLVVGDPAFDRAAVAGLGRLPGAAREAEGVAALYPRARLVAGETARRDSVLALLPAHGILHFAGHAVANPEQPELSYLALAPAGAGDDGLLRAREIGALRLSKMSVVVLSACSTLGARPTHVGAIAGLAYSFLRAGAPATVSSLWDVDDGATTPVLVAFHRHLARGEGAAEALRAAQREALRSPKGSTRAPRAWAAFIYTGP